MQQALVIGTFEAHEKQALAFAAARAGTRLQFHDVFSSALPTLKRGVAEVSCMFVTPECCAEVATCLRDDAQFFAVPIVALVNHATDYSFRSAYSDGADDAMAKGDLGGITRRLANLGDRPADMRPPANQGVGIIAFPDIVRRRVLGRTLRTAGFEVVYAESVAELMDAATGPHKPTLLVTHPSFPDGGGRRAIETVRETLGVPRLPALLLPAYDGENHYKAETSDQEQTGKLLFFAEEALRGEAKDLRASRRLHFNGLCAFREVGSLVPIFGLTHNISRQGLYVRTLDPPRPGSTLWFEMRAPGENEPMIHLRGTVVWRREPRQMGGAAPAGFGLRIETAHCPPQDIQLYQEKYDDLCDLTPSQSLAPQLSAVGAAV